MRRLSLLFAFLAACTFPDIGFSSGGGNPQGGEGTGAASTTSTTGGGGSGTGAGGAGAGGAPQGGQSAGGSTTTGPDPCDLDTDTYTKDQAGCDNGKAADCNDDDNRVHPDQMNFFPAPIVPGGSFDYDCSGIAEREYETACTCSLEKALYNVPAGAAGCGMSGTVFLCDNDLNITGGCKGTQEMTGVTQRCH